MNTVTTTHYELGADMKLAPVSDFYGRTMNPGDVIEWRGAYSHKSLITSKIENGRNVKFKCINLNGYSRHQVDAHSIKREDDKTLWHTQHYFKVGWMYENQIIQIEGLACQKEEADKAKADEDKRIHDEKLARGMEFHAKNFPWARSFIVAERIVDDSDIMTDYFAEHGEDMVVLAPSKHERNNFAEMRKAALKIPETAHLGPGKNKYIPIVVLLNDTTEPGIWKGCQSHWHKSMNKDASGKPISFPTLEELNEWTAKQEAPYPIGDMVFGWQWNYDGAEHREDYSGGKGLYLQLDGNPWRVYKMNSYSELIREGVLLALGSERVEHLTAKRLTTKKGV
jgi:hypothetical protein